MIKRWILAAVAVILLLGATAPALAAGTMSADELLGQWLREGYPDYVGGVYFDEASGQNTILLVNGLGEADVRALLTHPDSVRFESCTYAYPKLLQVHDEILEQMLAAYERGNSKIYTLSIGWGQEGGFGESGNELRVVVGVDRAEVGTYRTTYAEKYQDRVYVQADVEPIPMVDKGIINRWYIFSVLIIVFFPTLRLALGSKRNPLQRFKGG